MRLIRDALTAARSGLLRPGLPSTGALRLAAHSFYLTTNLGTAVAVNAVRDGRGDAVIDERGPVSWGALDERANRLAQALLERAAPGDRVAFLLRNGREAVECYAAIGRAGMTAAPLNTWAPRRELATIAAAQRPKVLVRGPEFAEATAEWDAAVLETGPGGGYEQALAAAAAHYPHVRGSGHIVTHTSGTTGAPKGAERQVGAAAARQLLDFLEAVPLRRSDRVLLAPPLFHAFAQALLGVAFTLGATVVLRDRFAPEEFADAVSADRVTVAALVPVMLRRVLDADAAPTGLRAVVVSGSALPPALRDRAEVAFGPVLYDLYGSTEAGFAAIAGPDDHRRRPGSVGRPAPGVRLRVVDGEGRALGPGEVGNVVVSSPLGFARYTGHPDAGGDVRLGDLGYLDGDGYLYLTGRSDELVVTGGENVYPSEVEEALEGHPGIMESAVLGVPDEEYGEVLHAYVVPAGSPGGPGGSGGPPVTEDDVTAFLRERLARYKVPKRVHVVEELPRTASGKVRKQDLQVQLPAS